MEITKIIDAIQKNRVRISDHADEEAGADELTLDEIYFSALHGEIIEHYPTDRPYPSCLIYGMTFSGDLFTLSGLTVKRTSGQCWLRYIGLIRTGGSIGVKGRTHDAV
jgi:hypothetical protein